MTDLANTLGIPPSAIPVILFAIYLLAKAVSRLIPDTATGWQAVVRNIASVISVDLSSRIAPGVTIATIAAQALTTKPINEKVAAAADVPTPPATGATA